MEHKEVQELPLEILHKIFSYCDLQTLQKLKLVSSYFHSIAREFSHKEFIKLLKRYHVNLNYYPSQKDLIEIKNNLFIYDLECIIEFLIKQIKEKRYTALHKYEMYLRKIKQQLQFLKKYSFFPLPDTVFSKMRSSEQYILDDTYKFEDFKLDPKYLTKHDSDIIVLVCKKFESLCLKEMSRRRGREKNDIKIALMKIKDLRI